DDAAAAGEQQPDGTIEPLVEAIDEPENGRRFCFENLARQRDLGARDAHHACTPAGLAADAAGAGRGIASCRAMASSCFSFRMSGSRYSRRSALLASLLARAGSS